LRLANNSPERESAADNGDEFAAGGGSQALLALSIIRLKKMEFEQESSIGE
jgi:hypothetical protein